MSANDRLERDLIAWFAETAAPRTPEYTPEISLRAARVRQRPRWTFLERWLPMSATTLGRQGIRLVPWRTVGLLVAVLLLLLLAAVVYVGSQRHVPAPFGPAVNGRIAFVLTPPGYGNRSSYHEPFGDILTVDPTTGATATLVGGPEADGVPAFSLDGTKLSFVRQVAGGVQLFAIDAAGGTPIPLTRDPLPGIREAAWAPDGRSVAFTVPTGDRSDLWIASTDGSGAGRLELGDVSAIAPQWRPPDGRELLFVGSEAPGLDELGAYHGIYGYDGATGLALYRVEPDALGLRRITASDGARLDYGRTSWTPDGERIVTQASGSGSTLMRVLVLDADGREVGSIGLDDGTYADHLAPVVSPDGTRIAYAVASGDLWRVHTAPLDGSGPDVPSDHEFGGLAASLHWSPDGKTIIVNHHYYPGTWLIDVDGGATRQASWTDPGYAAWQRLAP